MGLCPRCHTLQPDTLAVCGRCGARAASPSSATLPIAPHHGYAPPRVAYPPYPWRPPNAPHEVSPRALAATAIGGPPIALPPPARPSPRVAPPAPVRTSSRAPLAAAITGGAVALAAGAALGVYVWATRPAHRETLTPSDEDRVVAYEGLKVHVPGGALPKERTLGLSPNKRPKDAPADVLSPWEVSLDGEADAPIGLEVPIQLPRGARRVDLGGVTWDPAAKRWRPLESEVDPKTGALTLYTSHFSFFAARVAPPLVPHPTLRVDADDVRFPAGVELADKDLAARLVKQAADGKPDPVTVAGWNAFSEWFNLSQNVGTFGEQALMVESLEPLNKLANNAGLLFAGIQLAVDLMSGDTKAATFNGVKNATYWNVSALGSGALQLAFVGVFAIDYSLNKFATEAISSRYEIYDRAYHKYYATEKKRSGKEWRRLIQAEIARGGPPKAVEGRLVAMLDEHCGDFWKDETRVAHYFGQVSSNPWTGLGGLSQDVRDQISRSYKAELLSGTLAPVIAAVELAETRKQREKLWQTLKAMAAALNEEYPLRVVVKGPKPAVKDLEVKVVVPKDEQPKWLGRTNDKGEWTMQFTGWGWLSSGRPRTVRLVMPTDGGPPREIDAPMKLVKPGKEILVVIDPMGKIEGKWAIRGVVKSAKLDASFGPGAPLAGAIWGKASEWEKAQHDAERSMIGKPMAEQVVDFDQTLGSWRWNQVPDGDMIRLYSPLEADPKSMGYSTYWVKPTGPDTFTGRSLHVSRYAGKENRTEATITGTRVK